MSHLQHRIFRAWAKGMKGRDSTNIRAKLGPWYWCSTWKFVHSLPSENDSPLLTTYPRVLHGRCSVRRPGRRMFYSVYLYSKHSFAPLARKPRISNIFFDIMRLKRGRQSLQSTAEQCMGCCYPEEFKKQNRITNTKERSPCRFSDGKRSREKRNKTRRLQVIFYTGVSLSRLLPDIKFLPVKISWKYGTV